MRKGALIRKIKMQSETRVLIRQTEFETDVLVQRKDIQTLILKSRMEK
jgi:hypothetical protein